MHPNSGPRRRHSQELKAKVLAACAEPGASISGVALALGLNANLVRKWRSGRGTKRGGMAITPATSAASAPPSASVPEQRRLAEKQMYGGQLLVKNWVVRIAWRTHHEPSDTAPHS